MYINYISSEVCVCMYINKHTDFLLQINSLKVQLSKTSRDLVDLECTNGELKEEVETLEVSHSYSFSHILTSYKEYILHNAVLIACLRA